MTNLLSLSSPLRRAAWVAAAAVLAFSMSGCDVSVRDDPAPTEPAATTTEPEASATETDSETPDASAGVEPSDGTLPEGATWLYEVPSSSARGSGERTTAEVAGGAGGEFANSTSQWLGCEGAPDITTYELDGATDQLVGQIALREGTPAGLVAVVDISTDLGTVSRMRVEADGGAPLQINLDGATTLTFSALLQEGTCQPADESYVVLVDTYVN